MKVPRRKDHQKGSFLFYFRLLCVFFRVCGKYLPHTQKNHIKQHFHASTICREAFGEQCEILFGF